MQAFNAPLKTKATFSRRWQCLSVRGAGGIRTRVQSGRPYAFYMLSLTWLSGKARCKTTRLFLISLKFRLQGREPIRLALNCVRFLIGLVLGITARETSRSGTWCRNVLNLLLFGYAARAKLFSPVKKVATLDYRVASPHSACLHTTSSCCQNQVSPV